MELLLPNLEMKRSYEVINILKWPYSKLDNIFHNGRMVELKHNYQAIYKIAPLPLSVRSMMYDWTLPFFVEFASNNVVFEHYFIGVKGNCE